MKLLLFPYNPLYTTTTIHGIHSPPRFGDDAYGPVFTSVKIANYLLPLGALFPPHWQWQRELGRQT
jgi:hypothetical protein